MELGRGSNSAMPHPEQRPPSKREKLIFVQSWRIHNCLHDIGIKDALFEPLEDEQFNFALRVSPTPLTLKFVVCERPGILKLLPHSPPVMYIHVYCSPFLFRWIQPPLLRLMEAPWYLITYCFGFTSSALNSNRPWSSLSRRLYPEIKMQVFLSWLDQRSPL